MGKSNGKWISFQRLTTHFMDTIDLISQTIFDARQKNNELDRRKEKL